VGARSRYESIAKIVFAFTRQRTWAQAKLARRVDVQPRQLRKILLELQDAGMPLERERDRPHVYWSVPKGWLPGGVSLSGEEVAMALGLMIRLPPSGDRERLLNALAPFAKRPPADAVEHHGQQGPAADELWRLVPQAIADEQVLRMRYRSARGEAKARSVSPQRIDAEARHLIAWCHEAKALRRFHFKRVERIEVDGCDDGYVRVERRVLDGFMEQSVDGFHDASAARELAFHVTAEIAGWVAGDLPYGLHHEPADDGGLRVHGYVAGLAQVARYVVGLGAEAEAETPELRDAVAELARGALENAE